MEKNNFNSNSSGKVIKTNRDYYAFIPNSLPPEIGFDKKLINLLSEANHHLGNLSGLGMQLPNPNLLIIPYVRKEAVLSSRIEGTQASLSDLFYYEAARKEEKKREEKTTDVLEVINYVKAVEHGIKRLKEDFPLCLRLIREMHKILIKGVRGQHLTPGEFRVSQNWIGPPGCTLNDATFVPPPVDGMKKALNDFEEFLHKKDDLPILIKCAFLHYQFEAIHPFLDGNGRIGRLLIVFFLVQNNYLSYPMLYISEFFEKYRREYYDLLLNVSQKGEWNQWIEFFLRAVSNQSQDAIINAKSIINLCADYQRRVQARRPSLFVLKLLDEISKNPYINISLAAQKLKTSFPTAKSAIEYLCKEKILVEVTDKQRGKVYCARELLDLLDRT